MPTRANAKPRPKDAVNKGPARECFTRLDDGTITDFYAHEDGDDITEDTMRMLKQTREREAAKK